MLAALLAALLGMAQALSAKASTTVDAISTAVDALTDAVTNAITSITPPAPNEDGTSDGSEVNTTADGDGSQEETPATSNDDTEAEQEPPTSEDDNNSEADVSTGAEETSGDEEQEDDTGQTASADTNEEGAETEATEEDPFAEDAAPEPVQVSHEAVEVMTGRVHTFELDNVEDIASIEIRSLPEAGNVTVNPDNTLALVMTGETATGAMSFTYDVTYTDGTVETHTANLDVVEGAQEAGWGQGKFYMLETDENDDVIVEAGDVHRPVYVSESDDALSRADIAALEGIAESDVTTGWLVDHPEYGGSEEMALQTDVGMDVWGAITPNGSATSNWLLLESGYEYENVGRLIGYQVHGEDELHPLHVTSWGDGPKPVIADHQMVFQGDNDNIVFSGVSFGDGMFVLTAENMLLDNVSVTGSTFAIQQSDGITIRNSEITDIFHEESIDGDGVWEAFEDRTTGLYLASGEGLLLEGNLFDHNGWDAAEGGQPPSMWSHNLYIQSDTLDVTVHDNIFMQGASFGAQVRGGGFIEDNVFLDNNAAVNFVGGDYKDTGPVGNYTLFADNLVTSGAHKEAELIGGLTYGIQNNGEMTVMVDNIIAHLADPNNPEEIADKTVGHQPLYLDKDPLYNDTIIYNWLDADAIAEGVDDGVNIEGLDTAVLDQTTIQNFTAQLLGQETATIQDLSAYLREHSDDAFDGMSDAEMIIAFFQAGFGIAPDIRMEADTLRFVPNDLSDGIRWDNRLNWDTEDLPGTMDGDSVDLGGNWVQYGGTTTIEDFAFGSGGELRVSHGKLTIEGETTAGDWGGQFDISSAGQVWMNGYADDDQLDITLDGGRFANTGDIEGATSFDIEDGEAILATDDAAITFADGDYLHMVGDDADVGFDGDAGGVATLSLDGGGILSFEADDEGDLGTIEEFTSGAFGTDDPNIQSGVNLQDGILQVVLDDTSQNGTEVLIQVDEIIGTFDRIQIVGLADDNDAHVTVDYESDSVTLNVVGGGSGQAFYEELGNAATDTENTDLWDALTEGMGVYDDTPPELELHETVDTLMGDGIY